MYHTKKDKRSLASCDRIFKAVTALTKESSFEDLTITDVVRKAQVARATFYRNFDKLEDVLHYELNRKFEELYHFLQRYYDQHPEHHLSYFLTPFLKFWEEDSTIIELLIACDKLNILRQSFESLIMRGLNELDDTQFSENEKKIKSMIVNEEYGYFVAIRAGIAINIVIHWVKEGKNRSAEDVTNLIATLFSEGIGLQLFGRPKELLKYDPYPPFKK